MEAKRIKGAPVKGRVYGKVFNANENERFFAIVEQLKKSSCLNYEARFTLGAAGQFERGIITVEV